MKYLKKDSQAHKVLLNKANMLCMLINGEVKSIDYINKTAVISNKYGERKMEKITEIILVAGLGVISAFFGVLVPHYATKDRDKRERQEQLKRVKLLNKYKINKKNN